MITQMLTDFPYEQSAKKAAVTWYVNAGMYDEAEAVAKELLEENRSESNQVIYTDVIAQRAYSASDEELAASADPEISALVVKAENSVQKALADEDRYDAHMHEADVSMESARNEMLKRVKNYINVKRPASGETSGLYDLQIIKMNLLMNDQETALNGFNSLLEKLPDISPDSPVYTALLNIQADVESYTGADDSSLNEVYLRLKAEIGRLFDAQSQGVVNAQENGINSRAADILLSLLKYSKPEIVITETDTSSYPKLDVSFEMNIARDNLFGKDGEFYKDDFRITDTGLEIAWDDVTLNTSVGSGDTAICAVVDVADAEGTLKKNITETLKKIVDGTAKRAVVASDGTVLCGFDDQMKYYTAARELMPDSGGDSYTALMAGLSLFENRTNAAKCLLWITDKNELDTALRQDIIDGAKEYGVNLYIIYAGSEDASMYRSLAASASGAVFGLDTASEMMACAREIVSLLDNRYEITYRVANSSATQRNVTIEIPEKSLEGSAGYTPEVTE